jgi:hypothetical protein
MASFTKTPEFIKFKKVQDDFLSDYTAGEAAKIRQAFTEQCLSPLGYTNQAVFCFDKKLPEEDKLSHIADWIELWESGKFAPAGKPAPKKKKLSKRGTSLDAIKLDDSKPDVAQDPEKLEAVAVQPPEPEPEPEPKPKEESNMATTPKSKKEILMEALSALEEEENTGITEEQVEEISKRVAVKVFTDLFSEVSETITSTLSSYLEDTKNQ